MADETTPLTTVTSTKAPSTTDSSTTAPPTTAPPTTAPPTTAPSTTAPPTTAPPATDTPKTAPSTIDTPKTAPSTTDTPKTAPSTTDTPKTAPSTTDTPKTAPSTTDTPKTAPSTTDTPKTAPSTTAPSTTPLATATAGPSEEVSSNTHEESKITVEANRVEPKREGTKSLQRLKKRGDGTERRECHEKKPQDAGVKREVIPSVPVTDTRFMDVTFQFSIKNFSKVNMPLSSPPCWVNGMPWIIKAGPITVLSNEKENKEQKFLYAGLRCGGVWGAAFWACFGIVDLCLLPVNRNQSPYFVSSDFLFEKNIDHFAAPRFMLWENVLNPHHGYIEDDAVTFQVRLRTASPYVVNWSSDVLVRSSMQTIPVPPKQVNIEGKEKDSDNSDADEDDSDDESNDEDVSKDESLCAQKNLHMYI